MRCTIRLHRIASTLSLSLMLAGVGMSSPLALGHGLLLDEEPAGKPDVRAKGIEVTQGFQIFDPDDPANPANNSIELVEDAVTVARVYLEVSKGTNPGGAGPVVVTGTLQ